MNKKPLDQFKPRYVPQTGFGNIPHLYVTTTPSPDFSPDPPALPVVSVSEEEQRDSSRTAAS